MQHVDLYNSAQKISRKAIPLPWAPSHHLCLAEATEGKSKKILSSSYKRRLTKRCLGLLLPAWKRGIIKWFHLFLAKRGALSGIVLPFSRRAEETHCSWEQAARWCVTWKGRAPVEGLGVWSEHRLQNQASNYDSLMLIALYFWFWFCLVCFCFYNQRNQIGFF